MREATPLKATYNAAESTVLLPKQCMTHRDTWASGILMMMRLSVSHPHKIISDGITKAVFVMSISASKCRSDKMAFCIPIVDQRSRLWGNISAIGAKTQHWGRLG